MPSKKVSILLAVYNPKQDWFELLLESLSNQDYDNYDLVILDDCSPNYPFDKLKETVKEKVKNIKVHLYQNETNLGSNKSFEKLLSLTDSEYVAFSDQDDIWHTNKISKAIKLLEKENKKMICSDVRVIDENGNLVSNSFASYKKRFDLHPEEQFKYLLSKNFVIGCTVVMDRKLALEATPFFKTMVHDHILAIYASHQSELIVNDEAMIDYRVHTTNQTSTLNHINNRKDYLENYIKPYHETMICLNNKIDDPLLKEGLKWAELRIKNANREKGSFKNLKRMKSFNKKTTLFELYALRCQLLFKLALYFLKNNIM